MIKFFVLKRFSIYKKKQKCQTEIRQKQKEEALTRRGENTPEADSRTSAETANQQATCLSADF